MKRIYVVLLIFIGFFTIHGQESVRMLQGLSEISSENLMKTVNYLASKECAGRLPGHEGYNRAARYMASEFEKLHLKPLGDSGYFQMLNTDYVDILQPVELNLIENGSVIKKYKLGENFIYTGYSDSGSRF
jgi:hypothetical protein